MLNAEQLSKASGIRLCRMKGDDLFLCEEVHFVGKGAAVDTVLRRAEISGYVEVGGELKNHWADVIDPDGDIVFEVAWDGGSYHALKYRWARCKMLVG